MDTPILITHQTSQLDALLCGITLVHAACIMHDYTLATFLPPLSHDIMYQWWYDRLAEVTTGNRHIVVQLMPVSTRTAFIESAFPDMSTPTIVLSDQPGREAEMEVAGVVSLSKPTTQTGPFRATVEKLFVSPNHRRKGIAKAMMAKLEEVARQDGRWSLMLDTEAGSAAEKVYPRLGYIRMGVVEEYGYSPKDGRLVDEVWFWKDLRKSVPL